MSDEQLKLVASSTINGLFSSGKISAPISSMDLLSRVISSGPPSGLLPTPPPRFRLTDLPKFESILDSLSQNWDQGMITLARDDGGLTVMDVHLGSPGSANTLAGLTARKRKRVIDEDADSAAGNDDEQDSFEIPAGSTTLGSLSKELKEVYTILQKSTAKGRLLAEQVCILDFLSSRRFASDFSSTNRLTAALSPSALISLKKNARSTVACPLRRLPPQAPSPRLVMAFTFALLSAHIQTLPSATALTSTLVIPNQPMPNRPRSHLFLLLIRVKVLRVYPVALVLEEEARRKRRAGICIMRLTGMRKTVMPIVRGERSGSFASHIKSGLGWDLMGRICKW
jgi:hypothetical protein